MPDKVKLLSKVEAWSKDDVLHLYYANTPDALYKLPGAIFGISVPRMKLALAVGHAVAMS